MKANLNSKWKSFVEWVKLWPDAWSIPLSIFLFILTIPLFNWMLSVTVAPELAILQNFLIVSVEIAGANLLAFLGILLNFSIIYDYYKKPHAFTSDWLKITAWQRIQIFIAIYLVFILAVVWLLTSLQ